VRTTARTQTYRDDHARFVSLAGQITQKLSSETETKAAADELADLLAQLSGGLKVHLTMEDSALYPALARSHDPKVRRIAERFQSEMGGLKEAFGDYVKKWMVARNIEADPRGFAAETKQVFAALALRIERENNELYAAADALDVDGRDSGAGEQPQPKRRRANPQRQAFKVANSNDNWQEF
jgi:hypothetical protein